ncbi:phosphoadenosine phosphosulfate reductase family protein [Haloarchaeobius sp. TZWSO28]|uniref:phosphoadenosine phosphosulfate reductase family protein n=1 Tax=Haloarchaeobius sp. TZWSO28 TaxID=3446119 RepID=UPI003EBE427E
MEPTPAVDYALGTGETAEDYPTVEARLDRARGVVETALASYERPAICWTGGKDSTLLLWLVRQVAAERDLPVPPVVFIDHYQHFRETAAFVERWATRWKLDLHVARNRDFRTFEPGESVPVGALPERARRELRTVLDYDRDEFIVSADTTEGAHMLTTRALVDELENHGFDAVLTGVRWDEQYARADETFFSPRRDAPVPHDRVQPLLALGERDVWAVTWETVVPEAVVGYPMGHIPRNAADLPPDLSVSDLPVAPQYFHGYRSLGTASGSGRESDRPAWVLAGNGMPERAARADEPEAYMRRLRELGYM